MLREQWMLVRLGHQRENQRQIALRLYPCIKIASKQEYHLPTETFRPPLSRYRSRFSASCRGKLPFSQWSYATGRNSVFDSHHLLLRSSRMSLRKQSHLLQRNTPTGHTRIAHNVDRRAKRSCITISPWNTYLGVSSRGTLHFPAFSISLHIISPFWTIGTTIKSERGSRKCKNLCK